MKKFKIIIISFFIMTLTVPVFNMNAYASPVNTGEGENGSDASPASESVINKGIIFLDENGYYALTIKGIQSIELDELGSYGVGLDTKQAVLVEYEYANISYDKDLYLSDMEFQIVDEQGVEGQSARLGVLSSIEPSYPQKLGRGISCQANMVFQLENVSDHVTLKFRGNSFFNKEEFIFPLTIVSAATYSDFSDVPDFGEHAGVELIGEGKEDVTFYFYSLEFDPVTVSEYVRLLRDSGFVYKGSCQMPEGNHVLRYGKGDVRVSFGTMTDKFVIMIAQYNDQNLD